MNCTNPKTNEEIEERELTPEEQEFMDYTHYGRGEIV